MTKKKINWLLILQGWAMLWVVIGHAALGKAGAGPEWESALFNFAYSFHMPLFMLVSGWLFYLTRLRLNEITPPHLQSENGGRLTKKWAYSDIVKDKAVRLLIPGLVFCAVSFALKIVFPAEMSRQVGLNVGDVAHAFLYPYDNPFREFWFIATLFWLFLLAPIWEWALRQEWTKWGMLVLLAVLHFCHPSIALLCIGRVFSYAIWFYLGLLVSKENIVDKYLARLMWVTLVAGVIIYVAGKFSHPFVTTLGGIVLSFGLALIAEKYIPRLFCGFRNYTYQIFLMGILAQMFVKIMYRHVSVPYVAAFILCILAGLYVPVLVSKVVEKISWKPLSLCVGLKQAKK